MNVNKLMMMAAWLLVALSCKKADNVSAEMAIMAQQDPTEMRAGVTTTETFETGTKASYAAANVTLGTGVWNLNDALIGNTAADAKAGAQSARVRNSGKLTMQFNRTTGAGTVTVQHAKYGTDANGTWSLWYSTNSGTSYTQVGSSVTTSTTTLATATFTLNVAGTVRLEIRKTDGGTNRINFDNIAVDEFSAATNPAPALASISPNSANAGAAAFTLTVSGSNFINGSTVNWNGTALSTSFVSSTQLTASVPAVNVASPGSASVTVVTPAPGGGTSVAASFTINGATSGAKKFLFDNTKAQTAGNADWVIDQDNGTPQRIPTPLQNTVTASTGETYWTGGISAWGIALAKQGHTVETLPASGSITYGSTTNAQDLSKYDVFVIDEPNIRFTASEKTAILTFVQNGGGLFLVSNHDGSDRNNDGWDGVEILNDLMSNNTVQANPFGLSFDINSISQLTSNVRTNSSGHPILNGSQGGVTQLEYNSGASITINPTANASVQGLVWRSSISQGTTGVMAASSTFGTGRVFVVGDSSPMDDGTGAAGNNLFNGWGVYSHRALFMNASLWLAKLQ
jgi:hypothetical protein